MNVVLRLLKATVEFLWVGGVGGVGGVVGGVCKVIFMSNQTTVLRLCCWLCCVFVGVVTICKFQTRPGLRLIEGLILVKKLYCIHTVRIQSLEIISKNDGTI